MNRGASLPGWWEKDGSCVVVIPTYNERENIAAMLDELLKLPLPLELLVVDDNSPDGTADIVRKVATVNPRVHLLLRQGERGRGTAGIDGFRQSLAMGAAVVVEMDADFSHHPRYLPTMLAALHDCDVVIGSRFVAGGADLDRGWLRQIISRLAGIYVRTLLGLEIRDVSSGYRCFRQQVLEGLDFERMLSTGPSLVLEVLYNLHLQGWRIREVPIVFTDRCRGETKLDLGILVQTLWMVARLRCRK